MARKLDQIWAVNGLDLDKMDLFWSLCGQNLGNRAFCGFFVGTKWVSFVKMVLLWAQNGRIYETVVLFGASGGL